MPKKQTDDPADGQSLSLAEVRLVADLRITHAKVDELFQLVTNLKRRHNEAAIRDYADPPVLDEDINRVDQIYLWFLSLKEEGMRRTG
jgi:hypothetical protein